MDVSHDSQERYIITDGDGKTHYVECFMCALSLINDYKALQIQTYCDWYGSNYPITVTSVNYGGSVTVSPSTAIYIRGGSCVTARSAYNQTAADNLLTNGFSQYTSSEQRYSLPANTDVVLVSNAIDRWYAQPDSTRKETSTVFIIVVAVGVVLTTGSILAYRKLKRP